MDEINFIYLFIYLYNEICFDTQILNSSTR
jgi:hypothetical protein